MKRNVLKKAACVFLALLTVASLFSLTAFSVKNSYAGVTDAKTPTNSASLKFVKKLGEGYAFAPTSPVVHGDTLVVMSGKTLYKLNAQNGNVIASAKMVSNNTYTVVSPCVANGMIFVPLNDGKIQAFDFGTLKSLWVYTDALGGQSLCNITYNAGFIYTGFWKGETNNANYVCINVKDEKPGETNEAKKASWSFKSKGGFYLCDACVTSKFIVVGSENGVNDSTSNSRILALNKSTGKLAASLAVKGDVRSGVTYDSATNRYFTVSKAGYLYSFAVNSSTGAFSSKKSLQLSGPATATPVIYGKRVYFGASNGSGGGRLYVVNASTLKVIYYSALDGYPQAPVLVSTGYENEGKIYIYATVNKKPGSVYVFSDSKNQKSESKSVLYSPDEKYSQFCISRISAGEDGTLYYKNDSGAIFALSSKSENFIVVLINSIIAFFSGLFGSN